MNTKPKKESDDQIWLKYLSKIIDKKVIQEPKNLLTKELKQKMIIK